MGRAGPRAARLPGHGAIMPVTDPRIGNQNRRVWTPEQDAALKKLYDAGETFSKIAAAINGEFGTRYSRNAAIGRAGRQGIIDPKAKHTPKVVGIPELCGWLEKKGVQQISMMNKGGTQQVEDIKVTMVHADHSCGIQDGDQLIYGGEACGYVIEFDNGLKIYHAGDTNVFGDMKIIHELYSPDIAMLPIGDHFTMGPREAAYACDLLKAKTVIPMHFATFPVLTGTPGELSKLARGGQILEMRPGQTIE